LFRCAHSTVSRWQFGRNGSATALGSACGVQSQVRARNEVVGRVPVAALGQAEGDRDRLSRRGQFRVDRSKPGGNVGMDWAGEHTHELVTSVADDQIVWTQMRFERADDTDERVITSGVAVRVVDPLEMVYVDIRHGQRLAGPCGSCELARQLENASAAHIRLRQAVEGCLGPINGGRSSVHTRSAAVDFGLLTFTRAGAAVVERRAAIVLRFTTLRRAGTAVVVRSTAIQLRLPAVRGAGIAVGE
jgi:hypothetical protein